MQDLANRNGWLPDEFKVGVRHLLLKNNDLNTSWLSQQLPKCGQLETLDLSCNQIGCAPPPMPTSLVSLDLGSNGMQAAGIFMLTQQLPFLVRLERLDLSQNGVNAVACQQLAAAMVKMPRLRHLHLGKNEWMGDDGATLLAPAIMQLDSLFLSECSIQTAGMAALAHHLNRSSVSLLDVSKNRIGSQGLMGLASPALIKLDACSNRLGDECVAFLRGCPKLVCLYLNNNEIGDEGAAGLMGTGQLQSLDVSKNSITAAGITSMAAAGLGKLTTLNLSGASVSVEAARALALAMDRSPVIHTVYMSMYKFLLDDALERGVQRGKVLCLLGTPKLPDGDHSVKTRVLKWLLTRAD